MTHRAVADRYSLFRTGISFCKNGIFAAAQSTRLSPERPNIAAVACPGSSVKFPGYAHRADRVRRRVGMRQPVGERRRIHEKSNREIQRIGPHPFAAGFGSRQLRFRRQAGAFQHVESVPSHKQGPIMRGFGYRHGLRGGVRFLNGSCWMLVRIPDANIRNGVRAARLRQGDG